MEENGIEWKKFLVTEKSSVSNLNGLKEVMINKKIEWAPREIGSDEGIFDLKSERTMVIMINLNVL